MVFTIDGKTYNVGVTSFRRICAVMDGDNAGRVLSGRMMRDIIGTYYNFELTLSTKDLNAEAYDTLYEVLTAPADCHDVKMPYGQSVLAFEAYITNVSDNLVRSRDAENGLVHPSNLWSNLSVNFIAMEPAKHP